MDSKEFLRCKDLAGGVMMAAKNLISWSDRHPSHLLSDYGIFRQDVLKNALELSCMMVGVCACVCACMCVYVFVCVHVCVCMFVCMSVCVYMCVCIYVCLGSGCVSLGIPFFEINQHSLRLPGWALGYELPVINNFEQNYGN